MQLTDFHAKYMALSLDRLRWGTSLERLIETISNSHVDLNPHQIEAAMFATDSPFSKGVILADEVGLGKTIEAGLVIAQKWAEGQNRILIIVPANLKTQWKAELESKFYLDVVLLDGASFEQYKKAGCQNPFEQEAVVIVSFDFAHLKADCIQAIQWDMAVIDEAHRLRNVYRTDNIVATSIHKALGNCYKLLLTATPLQNSLMELYGLVSFIDEYTFGDLESFKTQFTYLRDEEQRAFDDLAERMHQICIRTLRRQVTEYVKYTNRLPLTQEFTPTADEQLLYDEFSRYLQRDKLWALPNSGRYLISLQLWKMLSSSSFAVAGTLAKLVDRLESMLESGYKQSSLKLRYLSEEGILDGDDPCVEDPLLNKKELTDEEKSSLSAEIDELKGYLSLANKITDNAKGEALLLALDRAFEKLKKLKAPQKALIYTESRRTQRYLAKLLDNSVYRNQYVLFHGGLSDNEKQRACISFEEKAKIMIATEAAAEGQNFQFCALVVNYDLPWNPQRIEQRIGRCHRYGQKFDVVVVNFLNRNNLADQRVFELLFEKFQLFEGVFGASDDILGSVDAVDFEGRILDIYSQCRTAKEIEQGFLELRESLAPQIDAVMSDIKKKLLENFDEEVVARLRLGYDDSSTYLNQIDQMLWELTKYILARYAEFDEDTKSFTLLKNPYYNSRHGYKRFGGSYVLDKRTPISERYRLKCSLAQTVLNEASEGLLVSAGEVSFDLSGHFGKMSVLEPLKGKEGYLCLNDLEIKYPSRRDFRLVFAGFSEDGAPLTQKQMQKLFSLSGEKCSGFDYAIDPAAEKKLTAQAEKEQAALTRELSSQNTDYFDLEIAKLEKWAHDVKRSMEKGLRALDGQISELQKQTKKAMKLVEKLKLQEQIFELENKRNDLRFHLYSEQAEIDRQKEELIKSVKEGLEMKISSKRIFTIKWKVI